MVLPRFFVPEANTTGTIVALPEDEARHLTRVLRLTVSDAIRIFDGRGQEWEAEVREIGRQGVRAQLTALVEAAREPGVDITLVLAVLKGDKMDDVVRDAVMLGVRTIKPVITERTEARAKALERGRRVQRWQRVAVASTKQCGRAVVPVVGEVEALASVLDSPQTAGRIVLVEPGAGQGEIRSLHDIPRAHAVDLFVGPEGGWTEGELARASAGGAMLVTLGQQTLRADAAPLVALTALRVLWRDL